MLKKLSLAALVAMGSMSFAGATDLSSAIQGVQLNGFLRIRAYWHDDDNTDNGGSEVSYNRWRTNAKLVFGVPVAEGTKIVWRVHSQTDVREKASNNVSNKKTSLTDSLFFLNYKKDAIGANVGVVPLGFLPYASSDPFTTAHGAGATATYTIQDSSIGSVTLAAGFVDELFNASADIYNYAGKTISNDVYTLGAIYKNDAIGSAQLWYAYITNLLDYDAMILADVNILKDYGIGVRLDYASSELSDSVDPNSDNHDFYNIAFTTKYQGISALLGYAGTNDNPGVITTSNDSKIGAVPVKLRNNIANETDVDDIYLKLGYDVNDATNIYVAYNNVSQDNDKGKGDSNEYKVGAGYKVNKKFSVSAYYDYLDMDKNTETDEAEARLQFLYTF